MSSETDKLRFLDGDTAEDFANKVVSGLKNDDGQIRTPGTVRISCEDFTLPDNLVFLGTTELQGTVISYYELFAGATEYFHGVQPSGFRAVPNPEEPPMSPFSMALEVSFDNPVQPSSQA